MYIYSVITILIVLAALFSYINVRFLKLPNTIGVMLIAIAFTIAIFLIRPVDDSLYGYLSGIVSSIDFRTVLMDILLGFLLFAGAMHTNFDQLKVQRYPILVFSTLGVLTSTFLVGSGIWILLGWLNHPVDYLYCLLFGALISPTDPIAVLGILKKAGVPKKLETKIVGESLFNDGVGVVVFITLYEIASSPGSHIDFSEIALLFGEEVIGGILLGFALGFFAYRLMKAIDDYDSEVMITLAVVTGGFLAAHHLHVSGPIAMVVAGLVVGNDTVRSSAMSEITEQYVDKFWELIDLLLNAILFVLIGLEIMILTFKPDYIISGLIAICIVLFARWASLSAPIYFFSKKLDFVPNTNLIMTWGGLRGGISIALALSLADHMERDLFLTMTYIIVVFSIVVQGLTVGKLVKTLNRSK
jgi:CPA1 family monovalent cation:H+ antiporter